MYLYGGSTDVYPVYLHLFLGGVCITVSTVPGPCIFCIICFSEWCLYFCINCIWSMYLLYQLYLSGVCIAVATLSGLVSSVSFVSEWCLYFYIHFTWAMYPLYHHYLSIVSTVTQIASPFGEGSFLHVVCCLSDPVLCSTTAKHKRDTPSPQPALVGTTKANELHFLLHV